jgi:hypothetical protein
MVVLKNYKNELVSIAIVFGLLTWSIYVCAAEPVKTKPVVVKAAKPAKEVKPAEVKKEHKKKPTLKKKYADKK